MQAFQFSDVMFAEFFSTARVPRVAEINPATERTPFPCRAQFALLKRAARFIDDSIDRQTRLQEQLGLGSRQIQPMAVFLKAAAPAAQVAYGCGRGDGLAQLGINLQELGPQRAFRGCFREIQMSITAACWRI